MQKQHYSSFAQKGLPLQLSEQFSMEDILATVNINMGEDRNKPVLTIRRNTNVVALINQFISSYGLPIETFQVIMAAIKHQLVKVDLEVNNFEGVCSLNRRERHEREILQITKEQREDYSRDSHTLQMNKQNTILSKNMKLKNKIESQSDQHQTSNKQKLLFITKNNSKPKPSQQISSKTQLSVTRIKTKSTNINQRCVSPIINDNKNTSNKVYQTNNINNIIGKNRTPQTNRNQQMNMNQPNNIEKVSGFIKNQKIVNHKKTPLRNRPLTVKQSKYRNRNSIHNINYIQTATRSKNLIQNKYIHNDNNNIQDKNNSNAILSQIYKFLTINQPKSIKTLSPQYINFEGFNPQILFILQQFFDYIHQQEMNKMDQQYFIQKINQNKQILKCIRQYEKAVKTANNEI